MNPLLHAIGIPKTSLQKSTGAWGETPIESCVVWSIVDSRRLKGAHGRDESFYQNECEHAGVLDTIWKP